MNAVEKRTAPLASSGIVPRYGFSAVRGQAAFVRALLDEVERLTTPGAADVVTEQLAEELERLGGEILAVASALNRRSS